MEARGLRNWTGRFCILTCIEQAPALHRSGAPRMLASTPPGAVGVPCVTCHDWGALGRPVTPRNQRGPLSNPRHLHRGAAGPRRRFSGLRGTTRRGPESAVSGDECRDERSRLRGPRLPQALGTGPGGLRPEGRGPERGARGPPAALARLQTCRNKRSHETGLAPSRAIPEPPNPRSSGRQSGRRAAERAWRWPGQDLHFINFHLGCIQFSPWGCFTESVEPSGNFQRPSSSQEATLLQAGQAPARANSPRKPEPGTPGLDGRARSAAETTWRRVINPSSAISRWGVSAAATAPFASEWRAGCAGLGAACGRAGVGLWGEQAQMP